MSEMRAVIQLISPPMWSHFYQHHYHIYIITFLLSLLVEVVPVSFFCDLTLKKQDILKLSTGFDEMFT